MACYLRIWGKFDPEVITQGLDLPINEAWREGELSSKGHVYEESLVQIRLSGTGLHEYQKQFAEAENFLRTHREAIAFLTKRDDTLESILDFGMAQPPHPAYYRRIPTSLVEIAAALRLAIELSFYACSNDPPTPAQENAAQALHEPGTSPSPLPP